MWKWYGNKTISKLKYIFHLDIQNDFLIFHVNSLTIPVCKVEPKEFPAGKNMFQVLKKWQNDILLSRHLLAQT